mmetsp:Transcript_7931/g.16093  ORF Transcript_7931/g.16093 Transcript_7931/m.16093 type:complete len:238 (+) Transcript_7931:53-766(+)
MSISNDVGAIGTKHMPQRMDDNIGHAFGTNRQAQEKETHANSSTDDTIYGRKLTIHQHVSQTNKYRGKGHDVIDEQGKPNRISLGVFIQLGIVVGKTGNTDKLYQETQKEIPLHGEGCTCGSIGNVTCQEGLTDRCGRVLGMQVGITHGPTTRGFIQCIRCRHNHILRFGYDKTGTAGCQFFQVGRRKLGKNVLKKREWFLLTTGHHRRRFLDNRGRFSLFIPKEFKWTHPLGSTGK